MPRRSRSSSRRFVPSWSRTACSCHGETKHERQTASRQQGQRPQGRRQRPGHRSRQGKGQLAHQGDSARGSRTRRCRRRTRNSPTTSSPISRNGSTPAPSIRATASSPPSPTASTGRSARSSGRSSRRRCRSCRRCKNGSWAKTPIDRFILAKLEAEKLTPVRPATQRELIRRATFDLTGLPPTPEEVEAFVKDESPDAFAKVVDRLLASPHYGERWGRHWLDVARYAEDQAHTFAVVAEHQRLALSRLGHQRVQRRHAVRSLRQAANRRRPDREGRRRPHQEPAGARLLRPRRPVLQEHRRRQGRPPTSSTTASTR